MTGDQARQCVAIARETIEEWKAKLLPLAGQGVVVADRQVTLLPVQPAAVVRTPKTLMIHVWAQVTMTQSMTGVVTLPPEYVENGTFTYPPYLVAAVSYSQAQGGYTWGTLQQILPEAGSTSTPAGELAPGALWAGDYFEGTGPGYDVEVTDLQKSAVITFYVRGRFAEDPNYATDSDDPATFDSNCNIGLRTLGTYLEGNRADPLPDEVETGEVRAGYNGTAVSVSPISRGAYPGNALTSIYSISFLSHN